MLKGFINYNRDMRIELEEKERLDRLLDKKKDKGEDFKVLVLKLIDEMRDIKKVSRVGRVPESTIYGWIEEWNKKKRVA